jgi:hypothetical protein
MSDSATGRSSIGELHPAAPQRKLNVAPTDGSTKYNTLRIPLIPVACWRINDPAFAFDSSFVSSGFRVELAALATKAQAYPGCPAAIFGHCDPAGSDALNKTLGDRRAIAIYAVLTRQPPLWAYLYDKPQVGDTWDLHMVQAMLQRVPDRGGMPYYTGKLDGVQGAGTTDAIQSFQGDSGLAADGQAGADTRKALFGAYMDWLCTAPTDEENEDAYDPSLPPVPHPVDPSVKPFHMKASDFLGGASAADGDLPAMSLQSCGKFNPVVLLPSSEMNQADTVSRNADDAPNRRVVLFFFPKGTKVDPAAWPCPEMKKSGDACKAQFWPNGDAQRQPGADLKLYRDTHDTMACRFYDRFARRSPCEKAQPSIIEFFVYPDGQKGKDGKDTLDASWGDQLRLGWMASGLVKTVAITNTATGQTSDVTFATGTNDGVYSLGWAPLCVTSTAVDESSVAEYQLTVTWSSGRSYDKCKVTVTMNGQNQESSYVLASIANDDAARAMGLGWRRELPTTLEA